MKRATGSILIFVSANRIARADFSSDNTLHTLRAASRATTAPLGEAVRAALALGGKAAGRVWVISDQVWTQKVSLSPAQVAGLSTEQLGRALSFEVEPFSGIPISESAIGFHSTESGSFEVVEMPIADRDGIQRAIEDSGGKLAGITHAGNAPDDEPSLRAWLAARMPGLLDGSLPLITTPAPAPSPNRFLITGIALEAAALVILFASGGWMTMQRKKLEHSNPAIAAVSREIEAANKQTATLKAELEALEKEQSQFERVTARRGALVELLKGLAVTRPEDVVVRSIQAEGASSLIVSGLSLEAGAVDEMSIVLTQSLRTAGWTAQPRQKTGKRSLTSGGPWEFSLTVTHDEAVHQSPMRLSQTEAQ